MPKIVTRAEWGARAPRTAPVPMPAAPIANLYHHTTGATLGQPQYDAWVRGIQNYHMDSNGWNDIGYNFLVAPDGTIFEGRGWDVVGAHAGPNTLGRCPCSNSNSNGIALLGDSNHPDAFTDAARLSLRWLLDESSRRHARPMQHWGHQDVHPTECPGGPMYVWEKNGLDVGGMPQPQPQPQPQPPPHQQPPPPAGWEQEIIRMLPTISQGSNGQAVRNAQGLLLSHGYDPRGIDGAFGANTTTAARSFQSTHSLAVDGIIGPNTWRALILT